MPKLGIWLGPAIVAGLVLVNVLMQIAGTRRAARQARARGVVRTSRPRLGFALVGLLLAGAELGLNLVYSHLGDMALGLFLAAGLAIWVIPAALRRC